ncbi:MAG: tail fiber domain-containing protein [Bryobacteraceae bacterium]
MGIAAGGNNVATVSSTGLSVPGNLGFGGMITWKGNPFIQNNLPSGYPLSETSVAVGVGALPGSSSGNTAMGTDALSNLTSGDGNTAVGRLAGGSVGQGEDNVAVGNAALCCGAGVPTMWGNTAIGTSALAFLAAGQSNTALGMDAGDKASGGSSNTFVGANAGENATSGSYNVFIANQGADYPDTESNTIRIGDSNQSHTYISGIYGVTPSGAGEVVINSAGQLGSVTSSRRFKTAIADMGDTTETLMSLRPVQFRYISHGPGAPLYYGLIAEEVAEIAPDLVGRNPDGEIETVFYDKVNAMLLNQVQTQQRQIESQKAEQVQLLSEVQSQKAQIEQFTEVVSHLESRLAELESRAK